MSPPDDPKNKDNGIAGREGPLSPLRILLVDDEQLVRVTLADMLENLGAQVEEAASADSALSLFISGDFDLVIADLVMPPKGGDALARDIVAIQPDFPVLIVTGGGTAAGDANTWPCLVKPFRESELLAAVRVALARQFSGGGDSPD